MRDTGWQTNATSGWSGARGAQRLAVDLGDLLCFFDLVGPRELAAAWVCQRRSGGLLASHLVQLGYLDEDVLTQFVSEIHRIPTIRLSEWYLDPVVVGLIPETFAWDRKVIAVNLEESVLIVAMADPTDVATIRDVKAQSGAASVEVVLVGEVDLADALRSHYPTT